MVRYDESFKRERSNKEYVINHHKRHLTCAGEWSTVRCTKNAINDVLRANSTKTNRKHQARCKFRVSPGALPRGGGAQSRAVVCRLVHVRIVACCDIGTP